jgi:hypothetical protein
MQVCQISKISADWITKGCHIHVQGVEMVLRPDHQGGILIKKVFEGTSAVYADAAETCAWKWLGELANRQRLYRDLARGRKFLTAASGALRDLARGRAAELTFVMAALKKLGI